MSIPHEQSLFDFEALISLWINAYRCADVSYVGVKTSQGPLLLFGRVFLQPMRAEIAETAFHFETAHVFAARFVSTATPADIKSFLEHASNGEILAVDGTYISIQKDRDFSTNFSPIHHPFVSEGPRLPCLRISGTSKHQLFASVADSRVLDWELKAAEVPFDNLDELLNQCGLPTPMGDLTTLEILANTPAMIVDTSAITETNAVIDCHLAADLDVAKLRLGYKVFHKDSVSRESVNGSKLDWREERDLKVGNFRMAVGDASLLQVFVSYSGVSQHQWWVTDPLKTLNPRHAIHQVFDSDLEILKKLLLSPEIEKSQMFETSVSTLFSLLGFSVCNYGRAPKLQEGPDIIAIAPSGNVGVVECTVGLLDRNDKLAKLVQRSMLIRQKLDHANYSYLQLQAVIVTPLARQEVAANLEMAGKHEIAVICKEEIEEMLSRISLLLDADKAFQDLKSLIPNAGQASLFGNTP